MKRAGLSITFFIFGLLTSWASMYLGSHMSFHLNVTLLPHISDACTEIGLCTVPWWVAALFAIYLFGPSLVFAATGWISAGPSTTTRQRLGRLLALIAITAMLYLFGYATRR